MLTYALKVCSFGNLATIMGSIAAALTLAIDFGMREQVGNVVSGLFIYFDSPFIKDYIKSGKIERIVEEINMRDTILNRAEKTVGPNSTLMKKTLKNFTKGSKTKTVISTEIVPYKLKEKTEILNQSGEENERILEKTESCQSSKRIG